MKLKASYTVEATIVISLSFIVFGVAIMVAYDLFQLILEYVLSKNSSFDAVTAFRVKEGIVGVVHAILD
jgi:hypothetical protein